MKQERLDRIQSIEHVEEYAYQHKLDTYERFLEYAEADKEEPELAAYVYDLKNVPLGELAVRLAIGRAVRRREQERERKLDIDFDAILAQNAEEDRFWQPAMGSVTVGIVNS